MELQISPELMEAIYAESRRCYPEEACGFVVGTASGGRMAEQVIPCKNLQNELHAKDPVRYPREAKTAYVIDPKEMQRIEGDAKRAGRELVAIFHSHPEHGVYFSDEDKGMAAPWGEPLFPNMSYLVVSVYGGEVKNASDFHWDASKKDFVEQKIK